MAHPREADGFFYPGKFGPNLKKRHAMMSLSETLQQGNCSQRTENVHEKQ
jgi:hypothetical protein